MNRKIAILSLYLAVSIAAFGQIGHKVQSCCCPTCCTASCGDDCCTGKCPGDCCAKATCSSDCCSHANQK